MPELPNLLRQRLAETKIGPAEAHPDADTLTAFSERSLLATEREMVATHLSGCEPCREVVALSQPQLTEQATQTVLKPASASAWRRLFTPAFGVGACVAAMVIIAALVLQLPQKHPQQVTGQQARNEAANQAIPSQASPNQSSQETQPAKTAQMLDQASPKPVGAVSSKPAETKSSGAGDKDVATVANAFRRTRRDETAGANIVAGLAPSAAASAPPSPARTLGLTAPPQKKDYVNTVFFANSAETIAPSSQSSNLPATPQPQGTASDNAFSTSNNKITMFNDLPANAAGKSQMRVVTPPPATEHSGWIISRIVGAGVHSLRLHPSGLAPALRSSNLGSSTIGGNGMFSSSLAKSQPVEVASAPEKSEAGALAASDSLSPNAMSAGARYAPSPTWKVVGGKLLKSSDQSQWEEADPGAGFEFSFVTARGNEIWAGGSHASLIHSRDGGTSWEKVMLGDAATGTVLSILAGSISVQVKTSDNQVWVSDDGGKTWARQSE